MSFSTYFPWACWSISHLMTLVRLPVSEKSCDFIGSICSIIPPFHQMDVYLWTCQTGTLSRCSLKCIISVTQLLLQKQTFLIIFFQWHWSSFCIFTKEKKKLIRRLCTGTLNYLVKVAISPNTLKFYFPLQVFAGDDPHWS